MGEDRTYIASEHSFDDLIDLLEDIQCNNSIEGKDDSIDEEKALEEGMQFATISRRFLKAANYYGSAHSYKLGQIAFDDLAQKISILALQYPGKAEELSDAYDEVRDYKKDIRAQFDSIENIVDRSYSQVSISLEEYEED